MTNTDELAKFRCVGASFLSGATMAASFSSLSWMAYKDRQEGRPNRCRSCFARTFNVIFSLLGSLTMIWATGLGPVSLAMPCQTAAQLVANMILEAVLVKARLGKQRSVGTMIVTIAIFMLVDIGPRDVDAESNLLELLQQPASLAFLSCALLACLWGAGMIWCERSNRWQIASQNGDRGLLEERRRRAASTVTARKETSMLGFVLAQAASIVLNTSLSKVLALQSGKPWFLGWVIIYLLVALFNFRVATLAAASLDLTVYVPVFAFVKLLLNCIAGLAIWEDWRTISHWLAYPALYLLMGCGVYLLSEFDLTQSVAMRQLIAESVPEQAEQMDGKEQWIASPSYYQATTATGDALGSLLDIWAMGWDMDPDRQGDAFQEFLEAGLRSGVISDSNLIELSTAQQAESLELRRALHQQQQACGQASSSVIFPGVARWIRKSCSLEPGVVGRIRSIELAPGDTIPASYRDLPSGLASPGASGAWRPMGTHGSRPLLAEISGDALATSGPVQASRQGQ